MWILAEDDAGTAAKLVVWRKRGSRRALSVLHARARRLRPRNLPVRIVPDLRRTFGNEQSATNARTDEASGGWVLAGAACSRLTGSVLVPSGGETNQTLRRSCYVGNSRTLVRTSRGKMSAQDPGMGRKPQPPLIVATNRQQQASDLPCGDRAETRTPERTPIRMTKDPTCRSLSAENAVAQHAKQPGRQRGR